ncbi:Porphobilinogen synthase [invertebrate metagenome]|uniref:Delta-aminolevulinic acid dehydratase n=1 Tax=invertebrate metagenome TaxID=1711999 RepID=A0A484H565_9ZZZZ
MIGISHFPRIRMRRTRQADWVRRLVAEAHITPADLIWPAFVCEGWNTCQPVTSMPGVTRQSIDLLVQMAGLAKTLGIPAVALFPIIDPALKTTDCREAWNPESLVCRAVRALKSAHPDLGIICDVALDPFNNLGHDGLVVDGTIVNDETIAALCRQAVVQAQAGCDIIAPSDMMDGRIGAIRMALDDAGFPDVLILSYAAKYASAFYGPFRDAVGSGGVLQGDKKTYQMDPANGNEALREVALDLAEGADLVMVKPGLPYLDIVQRVKATFAVPTFVYQVSGEYAMLKAAAAHGWVEDEAAMLESLIGFRRVGADAILTYAAIDIARLLQE